jgi:hypothetical protein
VISPSLLEQGTTAVPLTPHPHATNHPQLRPPAAGPFLPQRPGQPLPTQGLAGSRTKRLGEMQALPDYGGDRKFSVANDSYPREADKCAALPQTALRLPFCELPDFRLPAALLIPNIGVDGYGRFQSHHRRFLLPHLMVQVGQIVVQSRLPVPVAKGLAEG